MSERQADYGDTIKVFEMRIDGNPISTVHDDLEEVIVIIRNFLSRDVQPRELNLVKVRKVLMARKEYDALEDIPPEEIG